MMKDIVYFLEKKYSALYPVHVNRFSFYFGNDGYCELALRQTADGGQVLLGAYRDKGKVNIIDSTTGAFRDYEFNGKFNLVDLAEDVKSRSEFIESYQRAITESMENAKLNWILHISRPNYITLHYVNIHGELAESEFDPIVMAFRLNVSNEHMEQLRSILIKFKVGVMNEQTRLICSGL